MTLNDVSGMSCIFHAKLHNDVLETSPVAERLEEIHDQINILTLIG